MSGALTHSPADIVRTRLIELTLGTNPASNTAWPIFVSSEPDTPDNCITIYDTLGRDQGRVMWTGERQEMHGIQVRIRSQTHALGYTKARAIAVALDESIESDLVTIDATDYCLHSITRTSDVLALGLQKPASRRYLFTVNALVSVLLDS